MGPPLYMQSFIDRNIVMRRVTVHIFLLARPEVFTVALLRVQVLLDVMLCQRVTVSKCLEGTDLRLRRLRKMLRNNDPVTQYHISADPDNYFSACLLNFLSLVLMFIFHYHHQNNFETVYKFKMPEPAGTLRKVRRIQYKAHTNRSSSYLVYYTLLELFKYIWLY